jgi:phenylacetate-coenzyme A ligase PaaK-like adenylate-forming protein
MLSFPPGRCDDLISMPSGKVVHPQAVRTIFTNEEHVRQYRIVQSAPARFAVQIVASPQADRAAVEQRVRRGFAERFSPEARVDVAFVDSIDRTATGKFRPVIAQRPGAGAAPAPPGP